MSHQASRLGPSPRPAGVAVGEGLPKRDLLDIFYNFIVLRKEKSVTFSTPVGPGPDTTEAERTMLELALETVIFVVGLLDVLSSCED